MISCAVRVYATFLQSFGAVWASGHPLEVFIPCGPYSTKVNIIS